MNKLIEFIKNNLETIMFLKLIAFGIIAIALLMYSGLYIRDLKQELKVKNEIIATDDLIIDKHERQLELYGDYVVGILKGDDREERLMREDVLKAGEGLIKINKEIETLLNERK